ncbi:MAG: cytochrome P460 family protein [Hyphomicrobiaceae bacterium]
MLKQLSWTTVIAATLVLTGSAKGEGDRIAFPKDYRDKLVNYLSLDRTQNDDQVIRLFAPKSALEAANSGTEIPYGTVIVAEIYKAKKSENGKVLESSLGRRIRDKFAAVAIMEKRKGWGEKFPEELRNGDWDFAIFKPTGERLAGKNLNACRSCHAPLTQTQHLFSLQHLAN